MALEMISLRIDVKKIDKAKLYTGEKGTYLDVVLIPSSNNQYGNDYMAVQGLPEADRKAGVKGAILGNGKLIQRKQEQPAPLPTQAERQYAEAAGDDLPF